MDTAFIIAQIVGGMGQKIPFDRNVAKLTGSICSAVLLQQMLFWWQSKGCKPFYKFNTPCEHSWYKFDDSWTEELGIGLSALRNARDKIAKRAKNQQELEKFMQEDGVDYCFIYIKNRDNVTWYHVNLKAVGKLIKDAIKLEQERNSIKNASNEDRTSRNAEIASPLYTENTNNSNISPFFEEGENETDVREVSLPSPQPVNVTQKKVRWDKNARSMRIDFEIKDDIIANAVELGYDQLDVLDEAKRFVDYYKGKGKSSKYADWNNEFLQGWLFRNYRNGYLKRYGKLYKSSASDERIESIEKLLDPNLFAEFEGQP